MNLLRLSIEKTDIISKFPNKLTLYDLAGRFAAI